MFTLVLQTPTTWIYRLAGAEPYFTATSPGCTVTPHCAAVGSPHCQTDNPDSTGDLTCRGGEPKSTDTPRRSGRDGHLSSSDNPRDASRHVSLHTAFIGWALAAFLSVAPRSYFRRCGDAPGATSPGPLGSTTSAREDRRADPNCLS